MTVEHDVRSGRPSGQNRGSAGGRYGLADRLGMVARDLQRQPLEDLLAAIVRAVLETIPEAEGGSISLVAARKTTTLESLTSSVSERLGVIHTEEGQGPWLDAAHQRHTLRVPDLTSEDRWPAFARRAVAETEARSLVSPLFVDDEDLGAVNLYSTHRDAFTDESERIGLLVATHAAVALASSRHAAQLGEAIRSRDVIGQAKGILMERHELTAEQAFALLIRASNHTNRKLRDVAEHVADTRKLPSQTT